MYSNTKSKFKTAMCFGPKTSFTVWLISSAISGNMLKGNTFQQRWLGTLGLAVAGIQFIEGLAWTGNDHIAGKLLLPTLWSHTVINTWYAKEKTKMALPFLLLFSYLLLQSTKDRVYFIKPTNTNDTGNCSHMSWSGEKDKEIDYFKGNGGKLYAAGLLVPLMLYKETRVAGTLGLATCAYSFAKYPYGQASSMWCFVAAVIVPILSYLTSHPLE